MNQICAIQLILIFHLLQYLPFSYRYLRRYIVRACDIVTPDVGGINPVCVDQLSVVV